MAQMKEGSSSKKSSYKLMKNFTVGTIMVTEVISVNVSADFSSVPRKMNEHSMRHLPVVDGDNVLVGLITQRDLFRIQSPRKLADGTTHYNHDMLNDILLKHVMVKKPFFMYEDDSIGDALLKFVESKIGCIPIVDQEKKLIGIVTRADLLKVSVKVFSEMGLLQK